VILQLRARYLAALEEAAPDRIVVSRLTWPTYTADRVDTWRELHRFLQRHYDLAHETRWYRSYVRRPDDGRRR
jgi:hypothetical protein